MTKRPDDLIYGLQERPPWGALLLLAGQHAILAASYSLFAVMVAREIGCSEAQTQAFAGMALIAAAVATFLQALGRGPIGSGYTVAHINSVVYVAPSVAAGLAGGPNLIAGMTLFAGLCQAFLSRFMRRLRSVFPPEVCGVVVTLVALSLAGAVVRKFMGVGPGDSVVEGREVLVSSLTLGTLVALSVWGGRTLRLYSLLASLVVGYGLALAVGLMPADTWNRILAAPLLAPPDWVHTGWKFDFSLVGLFAMAALAATVKGSGLVVVSQKMNDADWKKADMAKVEKGLLADSLGTMTAGLLGGTGTNLAAASVGLCQASGATSRKIGLAAGVILGLLAFFPKITCVISLMPPPVMGAVLAYAGCVILISGLQLIVSRMLDSRRIFMVGLSILAAMGAKFGAEIYHDWPGWIKTILQSPITVGSVLAILLNLLFRIGVARKATLTLPPELSSLPETTAFFERQGRLWGLRPEDAFRASSAVSELWEGLLATGAARGPVELRANFDEFNLKIEVHYAGKPLIPSSEAPTPTEILDGEEGLTRLSAYLIGRYADRFKVTAQGETCLVQMSFEV
jgi:NCS2 family nucleobase:cation symporter-2